MPSVLAVPIDELIIGIIAFIIVFGGLAKIALPGIKKTLEERTNAIEGGIAKAEKAQAEAKAALDHYNAQLADARGEANKIREDARAHAAQIAAEMRAQAQAESARIVESAQKQIEAERLEAASVAAE